MASLSNRWRRGLIWGKRALLAGLCVGPPLIVLGLIRKTTFAADVDVRTHAVSFGLRPCPGRTRVLVPGGGAALRQLTVRTPRLLKPKAAEFSEVVALATKQGGLVLQGIDADGGGAVLMTAEPARGGSAWKVNLISNPTLGGGVPKAAAPKVSFTVDQAVILEPATIRANASRADDPMQIEAMAQDRRPLDVRFESWPGETSIVNTGVCVDSVVLARTVHDDLGPPRLESTVAGGNISVDRRTKIELTKGDWVALAGLKGELRELKLVEGQIHVVMSANVVRGLKVNERDETPRLIDRWLALFGGLGTLAGVVAFLGEILGILGLKKGSQPKKSRRNKKDPRPEAPPVHPVAQ